MPLYKREGGNGNSMDIMQRAPIRVCEAVDALARRFLKECGYKIDNFTDKRQLNRVKNRLERNNKELVHTQKTLENGNIAFWYTLFDTKRKEVVRESKILIIEPIKFTVTEQEINQEEETFTMPIEMFKKIIAKGV